MRVLELGPFPPPHGGVQTNIVAIRDYLRSQGISCAVINITRHRRADADEVYYPESAAALVRLLGRLDYDVLHLHLGGDLTLRLLALCTVCCLVPGKRTVLSFHSGGYPTSPAGQSARPGTLCGFVLRRFDCLIGVNEQIAEVFRKFGADPKRVRVIEPHAMVMESDAVLPEPLAAFFSSHNPLLLSVGLLEPEYDLPMQIEVLAEVKRRHPNAGLAMIGSGSLEHDLRRRIDASPCAADILLPGDVPHAATLRAIEQCSMLLRTTTFDGDSISVREALHLGTPVIATDNGMRPGGVHLIPISSQAALAQAIESCVGGWAGDSPTRRARHRQAGQENLESVLALYRELMK